MTPRRLSYRFFPSHAYKQNIFVHISPLIHQGLVSVQWPNIASS
jgi:hypothetical protein